MGDYTVRPSDLLFEDSVETSLSEAQATYYLREAWKKVMGCYPEINTLAIIWAQSGLETGRWKHIRNYNYGNIKRLEGGRYTSYECGEFIDGTHQLFHPYHPQTFFAAWDSALDGAIGYLMFLAGRKRYEKAWLALQTGNEVDYVFWLKSGGYFTAPLDKYTALVKTLTSEFKTRSIELLGWKPESKGIISIILGAFGKLF